MAGRGAPTFLKRQKELKRAAKAQAKREARQARRDSRKEAAANRDTVAEDPILHDSTQPEADADESSKD